MPVIKLDIDDETYARLARDAVTERRPIDWQAEVTLRRAIGLPFPAESKAEPHRADQAAPVTAA